jgi:hypothetical protein
LSQIIPGISAKLFQISLSIVAAAATGLLIAWISLRFVTCPWPRVVLAGLLATIIPPLILLLFKPELKKSLVEW